MRFLMQYKIHAKGRHLTKNTQHICTTQANGLFQFQIYRISMEIKGGEGWGKVPGRSHVSRRDQPC